MRMINLLIVDDHPLTCHSYNIIIKNACQKKLLPKIHIEEAHSIAEAYEKLKGKKSSEIKFNLLLLDILMPASEKNKIYSGEDLGLFVQKINPNIKILVQTALIDNHRLHNIFKNLNPEAILIKNDLDELTLIEAIKTVLNSEPFYSKTFAKLIRNQFSKDYILDAEDRKMLYLLSTGMPSKNIPNYLPWSLSKVEKRKRLLREKLGVENKSVLALIQRAKDAGFL